MDRFDHIQATTVAKRQQDRETRFGPRRGHAKLADEIRLSVIPIILGDGLLFFDHIGQEQLLHLKDVTAYKTGIVELWYEIKKN